MSREKSGWAWCTNGQSGWLPVANLERTTETWVRRQAQPGNRIIVVNVEFLAGSLSRSYGFGLDRTPTSSYDRAAEPRRVGLGRSTEEWCWFSL